MKARRTLFRTCSWLLCLSLLLATAPLHGLFAFASEAEFAGGNGSAETPYLIETKEHLRNVGNHLQANFKMIAHINFTDADFAPDGAFYNNGIGWLPIGTDGRYSQESFSGVFDGNGYTISGLRSYCFNEQYSNPPVYGGLFFGNSGTIINLGVIHSRFVGKPNAYDFVGGIVGYNSGTIARCYNTSEVEAFSNAGGIAGGNIGAIYDCFNAGTIITSHRAGGIAGYSDGAISTCYNIGNVSGYTAGGICGEYSVSPLNCYYADTEQTGGIPAHTDPSVPCTWEEMQRAYTFVGFDFDTVWDLSADASYSFPVLKSVAFVTNATAGNTTDFDGGTGNVLDPFRISNTTQLYNVRNYLNHVFVLTDDIVFTAQDFAEGGAFYHDGLGWQPLGRESEKTFHGIFNGNGHAIVGLPHALFEQNYGVIQQLGMIDMDITTTDTCVGAIACDNMGKISECYVTGNIAVTANEPFYVGGLVGSNSGLIKNSYNTAKIHATGSASLGYTGGLAGHNDFGEIRYCYNTGVIVSDKTVGSLVGRSTSGTIFSSYYYELANSGVGDGTNSGQKCTVDQLKEKDTFNGFDFDNVWEMGTSATYPGPVLQSTAHIQTMQPENTTDFAGGSGDLFNPYLISGTTHLDNIRAYAKEGCHFKLISDLTFSQEDFENGGAFYNNGDGWKPIPSFFGVFEGYSHTISGLRLTPSAVSGDFGLFSYNTGFIQNLDLQDMAVTLAENGTVHVGSVAGGNDGTIRNVDVDSDFSVTSNKTSAQKRSSQYGGIAGYSNGTIDNCHVSGSLTYEGDYIPTTYIGGVAGYAYGKISDTENTATITVSSPIIESHIANLYCGGIVGYNNYCQNIRTHNGGEINVTVQSVHTNQCYVGGIFGDGRGGTTQESHNSGRLSVTTTSNDVSVYTAVGGIGGRIRDGGAISRCYNTGDITVNSTMWFTHVGGIIGETEGSVGDCYNTGSLTVTQGYEENENGVYAAVGGIVGYGRSFGQVSRCYNVGLIQAGKGGAIIGCNDGIPHSNVYYADTHAAGIGTSEGSADKTQQLAIADMSDHTVFSGFNFSGVWEIDQTSGYAFPTLRDVLHTAPEHTCQKTPASMGRDASSHWYICNRCGAVVETVAHNFDSPCDPSCDDCGYEREAGHEPGKDYQSNLSSHWYFCSVCQQNVSSSHRYADAYATTCLDCLHTRVVTEISMHTLPTETTYWLGEDLDVSGGKITLVYDNQMKEVIDLTNEMVTGFNRNACRPQTLTVTYGNVTTTFVVTVRSDSDEWEETLGDIDGDTDITSTDARLILQYCAGKISADTLNLDMADVDGDADITSTDARLILQYCAGKISDWP